MYFILILVPTVVLMSPEWGKMVDNASSPTFSGSSHSSNVTTLDLKIQIEFEDSSPNVVTFEEWLLPLFGVSAWYDPVTHHLKQNMMFGNMTELCSSNI